MAGLWTWMDASIEERALATASSNARWPKRLATQACTTIAPSPAPVTAADDATREPRLGVAGLTPGASGSALEVGSAEGSRASDGRVRSVVSFAGTVVADGGSVVAGAACSGETAMIGASVSRLPC
jgi:hypothetical protein